MNPFETYNASELGRKYPASQFNEHGSATWFMGNDYRVKSGYYGAYPAGYLKRIKAMFPAAYYVLHVFAGKVEMGLWPFEQSVDINPDLKPTYVVSAEEMTEREILPGVWDLVLADPPYTAEDAKKYGTKMPNRRKVLKQCALAVRPGGHVVWLDTVWPQFSKKDLTLEGTVSMWRCTNHRIRGVSIFRRPLKEEL